MIRRLTCPICEKELPLEVTSESALFPFCTMRCKQVDLHRWFSGDYAIKEDLTPEKLFEQLAQQELPPEEAQ
ncbi:DNA gyrase inhibitor YacG [Planctomicrobium sp. SH668]|uniref:DNA gyrase inhibitor YacG n=1 Tax=Planctomicrobium sp. SH668 TaxID=3448126 RepID=UPI003F5B3C63